MRRLTIIAALFLVAVGGHAETIALGVGAVSASEVTVKIDGRDTRLRIDGVHLPATDPAKAFVQCLVAGRVLRIRKTASGAAKLTMLDGTSVADHVNEYLQTKTAMDPCALGKAAYQPESAKAEPAKKQ